MQKGNVMSELRIVPGPVDPVIRTHELPSIVGVSRAQIHRLVRQGKFPQLLKIGSRASGIRRSTLEQWLAAREGQ